MLTPRELLQTDFRVTMRGYHQKEVDHFVRRVVQSYESLMRQNKELSQKLAEVEQALGERDRDDVRSTELLKAAQENAVEIKSKAEGQAKLILQEAQAKATEMVQTAEQKARDAEARVELIRADERAVRASLKKLLEGALHMLAETEPKTGSEDQADDVTEAYLQAAASGDVSLDEESDSLENDRPDGL